MKNLAINNRATEAIYTIIDHDNMSQATFAKKIRISPSKLTEILKGRMSVQLDTLSLLCEQFNVSAEWLLTGRGEMMKQHGVISQAVSGDNNAAAVFGNATVAGTMSDKERISYLERIIEEKERTIQILLK